MKWLVTENVPTSCQIGFDLSCESCSDLRRERGNLGMLEKKKRKFTGNVYTRKRKLNEN